MIPTSLVVKEILIVFVDMSEIEEFFSKAVKLSRPKGTLLTKIPPSWWNATVSIWGLKKRLL